MKCQCNQLFDGTGGTLTVLDGFVEDVDLILVDIEVPNTREVEVRRKERSGIEVKKGEGR